ncbi:MAG: hypothetical protein QF879_17630 [Candidatus Latescibacteria bacterium]|nr:hypothetical protein [Candidatus Latescibacterota bacterium]
MRYAIDRLFASRLWIPCTESFEDEFFIAAFAIGEDRRHSYVAQQKRQIRSVWIVSPAMIEAAVRWREERESPAGEIPHRETHERAAESVAGRPEYRRPSVNYGAIPRADTATVRRVCAEAKAVLKAARGDDR